jgi:hypothetical protein
MMLDPQRTKRGRFCGGEKHRTIQMIATFTNPFVYSTDIYLVTGSVPGLEGMMVGPTLFRRFGGQ